MTKAPTAWSYWIEERLLAGKSPAHPLGDPAGVVTAICAAGVTAFVDLTEDGELPAYDHLLPTGVRHRRRPIADVSVTTPERMVETLDVIDAERARGIAYVHCWGGCGRTGTVVSCWLARHGTAPDEALRQFGAFSLAVCGRPCPETDEQRTMVLGWREGR